MMNFLELKDFLDEKVQQYLHADFIEQDPIKIPHRFVKKQDVEISAFLTATISWGNRKSIINSAEKMMILMDDDPYNFVLNASDKDLNVFEEKAIHRTFHGQDLKMFITNLRSIYQENESLESQFILQPSEENYYHALERFRVRFLKNPTHRSQKHVSSTYKNSAAKRLLMFLRWMVRNKDHGVDFGLWKESKAEFLSLPLDVHTAKISRKLGFLTRKQNDWKAVEEIDVFLRKLDKNDPSKYDYGIFGLGVIEHF